MILVYIFFSLALLCFLAASWIMRGKKSELINWIAILSIFTLTFYIAWQIIEYSVFKQHGLY